MTKCTKCGYEWNYKGQMYWATCSRCRKVTRTGLEEVAGETPAVESNEEDLPMTESMFLKMYSINNDINIFNQAVDQFGQDRVKELLHKNAT